MTTPRFRGEQALWVARLNHAAGYDGPCQWGNAYFRCPECHRAYDCTGDENWDALSLSCECEHDYNVSNLRISEGWLDNEFLMITHAATRQIGE